MLSITVSMSALTGGSSLYGRFLYVQVIKVTVDYFEEQGIIEIASAVNNAFGLHDNDIQDLAVSLCS